MVEDILSHDHILNLHPTLKQTHIELRITLPQDVSQFSKTQLLDKPKPLQVQSSYEFADLVSVVELVENELAVI